MCYLLAFGQLLLCFDLVFCLGFGAMIRMGRGCTSRWIFECFRAAFTSDNKERPRVYPAARAVHYHFVRPLPRPGIVYSHPFGNLILIKFAICRGSGRNLTNSPQ